MTTIDGGEFATAADLLPRQQEAWRRQARHVAVNSSFYGALWDGKAPPADLRDLVELPLSDKTQLRLSQAAHPPFGGYLAAPRQTAVRLHRTSGTTGQAMNLAMSARDCRITETVGGRCHRAAGLGPGHTVVHCLNYQMWMGGVTDHLTLEATGALVVPFGVGGTELLIRTIREVGITAISCTPSYPAVLEGVLAAKFPGLAPRDLGLKLGLFGGEAGWTTRHCASASAPPGAWSRAMPITAFRMCSRTSRRSASMTHGCISWPPTCCGRNLSIPRPQTRCRSRRARRANWC